MGSRVLIVCRQESGPGADRPVDGARRARSARALRTGLGRAAVSGGLLVVCFALAACSAPVPEHKKISATYDPKTGKLDLLKYDSNGDGKIDTWAYMDGARVVRIEIDKNEDGKIDRWEYYSPDQKLTEIATSRADNGKPDTWTHLGPGNLVAQVDMSTHGDGKIDRWEYYKDGLLARVEVDSNDDGRVDQWETYKDGHVTSVSFDSHHRGTPDRRLIYGPDGQLVRVEVDPAGTGQWQVVNTDRPVGK